MSEVKQSVEKVTAINIYGGVNRNDSTVGYYEMPTISYKTAKQNKSIRIWLYVLSAALLVLVYMVINLYSQDVPYDNNSAGLLIAALGTMVTALVGWQVFNAIENAKTLRKLKELEIQLNIQLNLSQRRNQELFDIAEAHRLEQEADKSTDNAYKYPCHLQALLLYVKSNVSFSYAPLRNKVSYLEMLVSEVERQKDDDKILFARQMNGWEQWYDELLDAIALRNEDLRQFRRQVIDLHERRKRLFDKYVGLETSVNRLMQEQRKAAEAKSKAVGAKDNTKD